MPRAATAILVFVLLVLSAAGEPPALWFPVGEELVYRVYWGPLPVAVTRVTTEWIEEGGRTLLAIRYRAKTNRLANKIYPLEDYVETIIDPVTFRPVRLTEKLRRRWRSRWDETTTFNYDAGMAFWTSRITGRSSVADLHGDAREMISFMYWRRNRPFVPETEEHHPLVANGKRWDALIKFGDVEDVDLPAFGKVPSIRIEPVVDLEGIFGLGGRVLMWASQDERRICTMLVGDVPVGSIKAVLCEVRGPGDDRWTRITKERLAKEKHPDAEAEESADDPLPAAE